MAGRLGIIAGRGKYPAAVARSARDQGVEVKVVAFYDETDEEWVKNYDTTWLRVGQLGRMLRVLEDGGVAEVIMAGQIRPANLFELRPDWKALMLLARLKERNAASIFGAIADELEARGIEVLPATRYVEHWLAKSGHCAGPIPKERTLEDLRYGFQIAKKISEWKIGQAVVVKQGTVLAVEAFEGTDPMIRRGAELGKRKGCVLVKVSEPNQDMRFDVPVVGERTVELAREYGVTAIGVEAGKTLIIDPPAVERLCESYRVTLWGMESPSALGAELSS
ncbi:MAG: UDP-2,3-diacylglucosamine diphosphatase LpxI [Verrucomicrobiae bacterium]|nr:UDP-2,3-diacylglucosamine diphosphatase LpxI [Verrucomicrobiae bacterium]